MTDIPPPSEAPPPPEDLEEQAAKIRNAAEAAAVGLFATTEVLSGADERVLEQISRKLVIGLTQSTLEAAGTGLKLSAIATFAKAAADSIVDQRMLSDMGQIVEGIRYANATAPPRDPGELTLARNGARNFATQAYAYALEKVVKHLPSWDGLSLKKTWVSQGDSRVRVLHRRLHGKTAPADGDFWRWPGTGQKLRFPGDPLAPPDATIGCRCLCWLSWSKPGELSKAVRTLPPMEDLPQ